MTEPDYDITGVKYNPMYDRTLTSVIAGYVRRFKRERYRRLNRLTHEELRTIEAEVAAAVQKGT